MAACLVQQPAAGQTGKLSAEDGLSRLTQFSNDVRKMREIAGAKLGPYLLMVRCPVAGIDQWPLRGFVFDKPRRLLETTLAGVEKDASSFSKNYEPTQAWIDGLPQFSVKFDNAADRVLGVQADIRAGRVPSDQQRQVVKTALQELVDDLGRSSEQLRSGTKALAIALQQQSSYRDTIKQAIEGYDQSAQDELGRLESLALSWPYPASCKVEMRDSFNRIKGQFSDFIREIWAAFETAVLSNRKAQEGLASLLGTTLNSQTKLQSVVEGVEAAKNEELGSFLEGLNISSAKIEWEELASAASKLSGSTN
jgi:hypothetical protein